MAELSAYWKGQNTYKLSKGAHDLARKVEAKDRTLGQQLHAALSALDANADAMLNEVISERDGLEASFEGQKADLRKELDGLKGDVKTLRGKVK